MKLFPILSLLTAVSFWQACQSNPSFQLIVSNPEDHTKVNELLTIDRSKIPSELNSFIITHKGNEIPYQLIQAEESTTWNQLLVLVSIDPQSTDTLHFTPVESVPQYANATQVRHQKLLANRSFSEGLMSDTMILGLAATDFSKEKLPPYLTEGPAWENDLVGFRLYFDRRNGRDIFGKLTEDLVLQDVGKDTTVSYHELQKWGMDILKVGGSLGAGAVAFSYKDTLYPLSGDQFESVVFQKLYDGPIQSAFKMKYKGFKIHPNLAPIDVEEKITITKGQWYYSNTVKVDNAPEDLYIVTGIVNLYNIPFKYLEIEQLMGMFSIGVQSENKDELGLAVIVDKNDFIGFDAAPSKDSRVVNTHLIKSKINPKGNEFKFLAMWSKSVGVLDEMVFVDEMNTILYNLSKPLSIKDIK